MTGLAQYALDCEIRHFHAAEAAATEALFEFLNGREPPPPLNIANAQSVRLWFDGLKRWGRAWPDREYTLREAQIR